MVLGTYQRWGGGPTFHRQDFAFVSLPRSSSHAVQPVAWPSTASAAVAAVSYDLRHCVSIQSSQRASSDRDGSIEKTPTVVSQCHAAGFRTKITLL